MLPKLETKAIAVSFSIEELFIAMQPTEKDRQEAIQFLKDETIRNQRSGQVGMEQKVAEVQKV